MSTTPEYAPEAGDTLEQLVQQFTNQYAFLRELIQNSIDAGTKRVDVWFEFDPFEGGCMGAMRLHVDDTGEGMNREIIDTQLTRLFSSSKENDLTKIGKFGIGFVSVFALSPEAVVVDTSRDGENWRILFHGKDKKFERIVLEQPIDGTQVQLIKMVSRDDYEKHRHESKRTITYWCKHCDVDIYVDNERINQPFTLNGPHVMTHQVPGTELVVAPADGPKPFYGFYNRGLTLVESIERDDPNDRQDHPPGIHFKIKSRYLEHTLTRDNILRDENYHKAMTILRSFVDGPFRKALFQAALEKGEDAVFGFLTHRLQGLPEDLANKPLLPLVDGGRLTLKQLKTAVDKQGEVFYEEQDTALTQSLRSQGKTVLKWAGPEREPGLGRLLEHLCRRKDKVLLLRASGTYAQPALVGGLSKNQQELLEAAGRILKRTGYSYRSIFPGRFRAAGASLEKRAYVLQEKAGSLFRPEGEKKGLLATLFGSRKSPQDLVVNLDDALVEKNFRLNEKYPQLAPYILAWCVLVNDGLDGATVTRMVEAAMAEGGDRQV